MLWYAPLITALKAAIFLAAHLLLAAGLIGAVWAIQWLLAEAGDPKLFDWIPLRYMFDVMDAGILAVFIWYGVGGAIDVFRAGRAARRRLRWPLDDNYDGRWGSLRPT